jgi:hypothetical protein
MSSTDPHAVPTVDELLEAVEECLQTEILPSADGRERYLLRVSIAALGQIRRELRLGAAHDTAHAERLATLGVASDEALAALIRDGAADAQRAEILAVLRAQIDDRLQIVAPPRAADQSPSGRQ